MILEDHQRLRHRVLEWYAENGREDDWNDPKDKEEMFMKEFDNLRIAPEESKLRSNIETTLKDLRKVDKIEHILVYFHQNTPPKIITSYNDITFKKILIKYRPEKGNYLEINISL